MNDNYFEEQNFKNIDFALENSFNGDYENCSFSSCNFSGMNLFRVNFGECTFTNCDFSLAKLSGTSFRDTQFTGCKILGVHFEECNKQFFSAAFKECKLDMSSFYNMRLKNMTFEDCSLVETDFTESDLTSAIFDNCDLQRTVFHSNNLTKADLRTSFNFSIDPEINKIEKARFSMLSIAGLLDKYNIIIE